MLFNLEIATYVSFLNLFFILITPLFRLNLIEKYT
jgi:hypothetical protein